MNGQMPRISALVIFCKSDKLQSRWQINPNSVEKKYQNIFCKTIERYFANMLKDILQVGQLAKQVVTKPKRSRKNIITWFCTNIKRYFANILKDISQVRQLVTNWQIRAWQKSLGSFCALIVQQLLTPCLALT